MLNADVAVAPGLAFGEYGEGYVRIGLVENEHRIRQAAKILKNYSVNFLRIIFKSKSSKIIDGFIDSKFYNYF